MTSQLRDKAGMAATKRGDAIELAPICVPGTTERLELLGRLRTKTSGYLRKGQRTWKPS